MKTGILVGILPGDSRSGQEVVGSPAPYREALAGYNEAVNDPEVAAKYAALELWTRSGLAKKRKLRAPAPVAPAAEAPAAEEPRKPSKKAAPRKRAAATKEKE